MDLFLLTIPPIIAIMGVAWYSIQAKVRHNVTRKTARTMWGTLILALLMALAFAVLRPGRYATLSFGGIAALAGMIALAERVLLRLPQSKLRIRVGDPFPSFVVKRMDGAPFTRDDLLTVAPAYVVFYRGHW